MSVVLNASRSPENIGVWYNRPIFPGEEGALQLKAYHGCDGVARLKVLEAGNSFECMKCGDKFYREVSNSIGVLGSTEEEVALWVSEWTNIPAENITVSIES